MSGWSHLISGLKHLVPHGLREEIRRQMAGPENLFRVCSPSLLPVLSKAIVHQRDHGQLEGKGYYEFGIFRGYALWFAQQLVKELGADDFYCYGFDSFAGLPKPEGIDAGAEFLEGDYSASYEEVRRFLSEHGADFDHLSLNRGYFSDDLFERLARQNDFRKASVVLVDCDLYVSTVPVLRFIGPLLEHGTILLFDDYNCFGAADDKGQRKAFAEFLAENEWVRGRPWADFGWHGASFVIEMTPLRKCER